MSENKTKTDEYRKSGIESSDVYEFDASGARMGLMLGWAVMCWVVSVVAHDIVQCTVLYVESNASAEHHCRTLPHKTASIPTTAQ